MNGTLGIQEVWSLTSRSPSRSGSCTNNGINSEQVPGTFSPNYELPLMEPQVRMMTPLLTASQNRIASCNGQQNNPRKVPDSFPSSPSYVT